MNRPPQIAARFLRWFCPPELSEGIEGDLTEQFEKDFREAGKRIAQWKFAFNTLSFFRPSIIFRNKLKIEFMNTIMLGNYFKVAVRNLMKSKIYSAITIGGLAIGIACSLVIFLFVYGEWSYDRGFAKSERIYRVGISFFNIGQFACGPEKLADVLPKEFDGIETVTRVRNERSVPLEIKDKSFTENAYYVDSAYFKIFNYDFVSGGGKTLLCKPNEAVVNGSRQEFF